MEDDVPSGRCQHRNITICDSNVAIYDNINLNNVTDEIAASHDIVATDIVGPVICTNTSTSETVPSKGISRIAKTKTISNY